MENLKDYLFYGSLNKRDWNRVRDVIWEKDNRIILLTVSFSMFILMTFLTIYTVFWDKVYQENAPAYGVVAALELVLYLFAKSATKSNMASLPLLTFVFNLVTFALGIDLGTFLDPNSYALAFVVMVIVLPMLF